MISLCGIDHSVMTLSHCCYFAVFGVLTRVSVCVCLHVYMRACVCMCVSCVRVRAHACVSVFAHVFIFAGELLQFLLCLSPTASVNCFSGSIIIAATCNLP